MSNNLVPLALENHFQRQGQERGFAFQRERDDRNLQVQMAMNQLEAYMTGLANSKTPQELRKTHAIMSKSVEKLTKDLPGGPIILFNDSDLDNIQKLMEADPSAPINSAIAEEAARSYAGLLSGSQSGAQIVANMSSRVNELLKTHDPTRVQQSSVAGYQSLIDAMEKQAATKTVEQQLKMSVLNKMPQINMRSPAEFYMNFMQNIDANAASYAHQVAFPGRIPGQVSGADLIDLAVRSTGITSSEKMSPTEQASLVQVGQAQWEKILRNTRAEMEAQYLSKTAPLLSRMEEQSQEDQMNFFIQMANQFDTSGKLKPVDFHSMGMDQIAQEVLDKFTQGIPTNRDAENVTSAVDTLVSSGLLDKANLGKFSKMSPEERGKAAGSIENSMRVIKHNGTSVYDLFFDKDGLVRPHLDMLVNLDLDKLAAGDPVVWDLAKHLTEKGTDPADFRTKKDGKTIGIVEAMRHSLESDANKYQTRSQFITGPTGTIDPLSRFSQTLVQSIPDADATALEEASKRLDQALLSGSPEAKESIQRTMFGDQLVESAKRLKDSFREMVMTGNYEAGLMASPADRAMQIFQMADKKAMDYVEPPEEGSPLAGSGSPQRDPRTSARESIQRAALPPVTVRRP